MNVEEIKEKQKKAHARLKRIEDGADHETIADAYECAFDLVDDALDAAIKIIEGQGGSLVDHYTF